MHCSVLAVYLLVPALVHSLQFTAGDIVRWRIDLSSVYRLGVFCSRLEVHCVPETTTYLSVSSLLASTSESVGKFKYDWLVELGVVYEFEWQIPPSSYTRFPSMASTAIDYHLILACVEPLATPSDQVSEVNWFERERYPLAWSKTFDIRPLSGRYSPRLSNSLDDGEPFQAILKDVSPIDFYTDNPDMKCPISMDMPHFPISDDHGHVLDAALFFQFIFKDHGGASEMDPYYGYENKAFMCVNRHAVRQLRLDEQLLAWRLKFTPEVLDQLSQESERADQPSSSLSSGAQRRLVTIRIEPPPRDDWTGKLCYDRDNIADCLQGHEEIRLHIQELYQKTPGFGRLFKWPALRSLLQSKPVSDFLRWEGHILNAHSVLKTEYFKEFWSLIGDILHKLGLRDIVVYAVPIIIWFAWLSVVIITPAVILSQHQLWQKLGIAGALTDRATLSYDRFTSLVKGAGLDAVMAYKRLVERFEKGKSSLGYPLETLDNMAILENAPR